VASQRIRGALGTGTLPSWPDSLSSLKNKRGLQQETQPSWKPSALSKLESVINQPFVDEALESMVSVQFTPGPVSTAPFLTTPNHGAGTTMVSFITDLAAVRWDTHNRWITSTPSDITLSLAATDSLSGILLVTNPAVCPAGQSTLNCTNYASAPHGNLPENECDNNPSNCLYLLSHKVAPGSKGYFWFLQVGFNYLDDNNSKTTLLFGLLAQMEILPGAIDGFELHPLDESSSLPFLTSNQVENGFLSSAVLAFKYFLVKNKQSTCGNLQQTSFSDPPAASPHLFNKEEEFKPSPYLWAVIPGRGNNNIKDSSEGIGWISMSLDLFSGIKNISLRTQMHRLCSCAFPVCSIGMA
jgi:hypothetical protein